MNHRNSRIRIRCPFCGALNWESQWNRIHPIQAYAQVSNGGRGKHNALEYYEITDPNIIQSVKNAAINRCLDILRRLNFDFDPSVVISLPPSATFEPLDFSLIYTVDGDVVIQ